MRVDLAELARVLAYLREIEAVELADIKWCRDGIAVPVAEEAIREWEFVGLNNREFARHHLLGEPSNITMIYAVGGGHG